MSNQILFWASFLIAWASTVFLKRDEMRRYMPVALFCMVVFTFLLEAGITLQWWAITEAAFPLVNMPLFVYGSYLIGTIWIFKFTYGRFWTYLATNIILDFILIFFILNWLVQRGVCQFYISYFQVLFITTLLSVLIYGYQLWQEGSVMFAAAPSLQSAASKPLDEDQIDKP